MVPVLVATQRRDGPLHTEQYAYAAAYHVPSHWTWVSRSTRTWRDVPSVTTLVAVLTLIAVDVEVAMDVCVSVLVEVVRSMEVRLFIWSVVVGLPVPASKPASAKHRAGCRRGPLVEATGRVRRLGQQAPLLQRGAVPHAFNGIHLPQPRPGTVEPGRQQCPVPVHLESFRHATAVV